MLELVEQRRLQKERRMKASHLKKLALLHDRFKPPNSGGLLAGAKVVVVVVAAAAAAGVVCACAGG